MMENNSPRTLFSLVALIFFAPIVSILLKDDGNDYELTNDDLKIINSYKKAGYFIWGLVLAIITILVIYLKFNFGILLYLSYVLVIITVVYMIWNIKLIFSGKGALLFSGEDIKKIEIQEVKAGNIDYLLLYLPFINEYLFQTKKYTQEQAYWLKESIFIYFFLALIGVFAIFFPNLINLFYIVLFFIIIRVVSLFFGIDFIPDNVKENIYNSYKKNIIELFTYLCALLHFIFQNLYLLLTGKRRNEYGYYLHKAKNFIEQEIEINSILKKPKKYVSIILSYLILIIIFGYLLYKSWYSFYPYIYTIATIILASFFMGVVLNKKLFNIPILSGILSKIVSKFN